MDFAQIGSFISTVGFPVVMCIMMYDRMGKQDERHEEEIQKLTETINNNTVAINVLSAKIDGKGEQ